MSQSTPMQQPDTSAGRTSAECIPTGEEHIPDYLPTPPSQRPDKSILILTVERERLNSSQFSFSRSVVLSSKVDGSIQLGNISSEKK